VHLNEIGVIPDVPITGNSSTGTSKKDGEELLKHAGEKLDGAVGFGKGTNSLVPISPR
jgi:hypothetical protein